MEKHNDTEVITRLKYTSENIVAIISFCCAKFEKKKNCQIPMVGTEAIYGI